MAFHDEIFPQRLTFGVTGGPRRDVDIVELSSGHEHRNARTAYARRRYVIPGATRPLSEARQLLSFFEARGGPLHAFRFRDPFDYCTGGGDTPSATDVTVAVGDGNQSGFPIRVADERPPVLIVPGSHVVAIDSSVIADGIDYEIDLITNTISLNEPLADGVELTAGFLFDVPVRFESPQLAVTSVNAEAAAHEEITLSEVLL